MTVDFMLNKWHLGLFALMAASSALAEVKLASPFTSHMVLQRGTKVPVWGTAAAGEQVTVEFAGQKVSVRADGEGRWRSDLEPLKESAEGRAFVVSGDHTAQPIALRDVLVGEVWLASGQSNMNFTVSKSVKRYAGVMNEEQEIAAANYPLIRMFISEELRAFAPVDHNAGEWRVCTPENVPAFSGVGYFFARDLHKEIQVPVGVIKAAFGASTAEAWIRREAMAADPKLKPMLDQFDADVAKFRALSAPAAGVAETRSEDVSAPKPKKRERVRPPQDPAQDQHNATVMFNGMIAPHVPYAIRGVIWYQGESIKSDMGGVALYPRVQATLVRDWRKLWGLGDFPFYIVQLAGGGRPDAREAQATVLSLPNTGMAVAIDIGDAKDVHPKNKQDVGNRLARIALANTYGEKMEYSGPVYESMKVEGAAVRLRFTHGDGLRTQEGDLKWFTVAGENGKFVPATAKIDGDSIMVSSPNVAAPVAVRYAWVNFPDSGLLYNAAGLPAVPFRTDAPKFDMND